MMDSVLIGLWLNGGVFLFSIVAKSVLPSKEMMSFDELRKRYPRIKQTNNLGMFSLFGSLLVSLGLVYLGQKYSSPRCFLMVILIIALGQLSEGVSSLSNGVYSRGLKSNVEYYYDDNKKFIWIAKSQILLSFCIALVIAFLVVKSFVNL